LKDLYKPTLKTSKKQKLIHNLSSTYVAQYIKNLIIETYANSKKHNTNQQHTSP